MFETNEQRYLRLRWTFDPSFRAWMFILASNLAIAGALCMAFRLGYQRGVDDGWGCNRGKWFPGCGRSALEQAERQEGRR